MNATHATREEKLQVCNDIRALEQQQGPPLPVLSPEKIDSNWKKCLLTGKQSYESVQAVNRVILERRKPAALPGSKDPKRLRVSDFPSPPKGPAAGGVAGIGTSSHLRRTRPLVRQRPFALARPFARPPYESPCGKTYQRVYETGRSATHGGFFSSVPSLVCRPSATPAKSHRRSSSPVIARATQP